MKEISIEWLEQVIGIPNTVNYIDADKSVPILLLEILKELKQLKKSI
jgi:hypothetical protein